MREGAALLQGLATCGHCGRKLHTHYRGKNQAPGYHCSGKSIVDGRGVYCLNVGGVQIDEAVVNAFLSAVAPAGLAASTACGGAAASRPRRRPGPMAPGSRARRLRGPARRAPLSRGRPRQPAGGPRARDAMGAAPARPRAGAQRTHAPRATSAQQLTADEREHVLALGQDLQRLWTRAVDHRRATRRNCCAPCWRKSSSACTASEYRALLTLRWRGGLLTECDVSLPRSRPATVRTDEDTIALVRRLALHHDDAMIAGILNRQGRTTARGLRFTANLVGNLRRHWDIPRFEPPEPAAGELLSIQQAAKSWASRLDPSSLAQRRLHRRRAGHARARPGGFASPMHCVRRFVEDAPPGLCRRCWKPPSDSACPGRRCCSVSSAANSKPCSCATRTQKRLANQSVG